MQDVLHFLVTRLWWTYDPQGDPYSQPYHWINLVEGTAWLIFALLVLLRYKKNKHSPLELWYALAFITFGLSDFREAYYLHSWLILFKGANLVALFMLRRIVMRRFYPASKVY